MLVPNTRIHLGLKVGWMVEAVTVLSQRNHFRYPLLKHEMKQFMQIYEMGISFFPHSCASTVGEPSFQNTQV